MNCDRYIEWLSARLDGVLTEDEERALEEHLAVCPECRAAGAQLAALQGAFHELEEVCPPEGFAQGVMDRIRETEANKVFPLFKRPRWKVLAGLAACLALAVGLYGVSGPRNLDKTEKMDVAARSFSRDAVSEELEDIPQIAAYSDSDIPVGDAYGAQKSVPDAASFSATPMGSTKVLTLEHMPEGGWDLIPPGAFAFQEGVFVTEDLFEQLEQMAAEQGITASVTTSREEAEEFVIVVLEKTE